MKQKATQLLSLSVAGGATGVMLAAYLKDSRAAKRRIASGSQLVDGAIEFADSGDGPPILVIHGAGGGWDQGLELGRGLAGDHYRLVAPSRFGYLGTPLPPDSSPEAQAAAHVRLLDALGIDRVPVIGISAGVPSAMQLCLKHPERCSALILVVPLAYPPRAAASRFFGAVLQTVTASDFLFWAAMKVAHLKLVETILGTPIRDYWTATDEDRRDLDAMLRSILPISKRAAGIANDAKIGSTLTRYALEEIRVPTLIIGAENCLYGTYQGSVYTAEHVPNAKLVTFKRGGHLLVGHKAEVQSEVAAFLALTFAQSSRNLLQEEIRECAPLPSR